tara:strand:- start:832 stop:1173 length:342 start_codon:yes stop_codon:yes gene_type:complete
MSRRIFPDNDAWSTEASRAANNINVALMDLLAILEEDGPVDLRDFHYLVTHVAGSFTSGLAITRRLGDPAEPPDSIRRAYPKLGPSCSEDEGKKACEDKQDDRIWTEGYAVWT